MPSFARIASKHTWQALDTQVLDHFVKNESQFKCIRKKSGTNPSNRAPILDGFSVVLKKHASFSQEKCLFREASISITAIYIGSMTNTPYRS